MFRRFSVRLSRLWCHFVHIQQHCRPTAARCLKMFQDVSRYFNMILMSCCSCSWVLEDIKNVTGTSAVIFYNTSAPHAVPAFLNLCLGRMETLQVFSAFEMRCFVIKAFKRSPAVATWLKLKWMKCLICRTSRVTLSLVSSKVLRCANTSMYLPNLHVSSSILSILL